MTSDERARFEASPHAADAVRLLRWHDQARVEGRRTPPLAYYLGLADELVRQDGPTDARVVIGALDAA